MTKTYVLYTEAGKEQYLADLLTSSIIKYNPGSAERIYVPLKTMLIKSAMTGQKWVEEKTLLFPNYIFIESENIELFNTRLYEPGFETSYHLLGKGTSRRSEVSNKGIGKPPFKKSTVPAEDYFERVIYPVSDVDMERLGRLMGEGDFVDISHGIKENGKVRFTAGPLVGMEGEVVNIKHHKRTATLRMMFLGEMRNIEMAVDIENV